MCHGTVMWRASSKAVCGCLSLFCVCRRGGALATVDAPTDLGVAGAYFEVKILSLPQRGAPVMIGFSSHGRPSSSSFYVEFSVDTGTLEVRGGSPKAPLTKLWVEGTFAVQGSIIGLGITTGGSRLVVTLDGKTVAQVTSGLEQLLSSGRVPGPIPVVASVSLFKKGTLVAAALEAPFAAAEDEASLQQRLLQ